MINPAATHPDAAGNTAFASAWTGPLDPDILALEARLRSAQLGAHLNELADLISDHLLFAGPDGQLVSKAQDLGAYRSGVVRFLQHEPVQLQVRRLCGDIAVASLAARLVVLVNGTEMAGNFRYTRVWQVESDGRWRVVAGQVGPIAAAL